MGNRVLLGLVVKIVLRLCQQHCVHKAGETLTFRTEKVETVYHLTGSEEIVFVILVLHCVRFNTHVAEAGVANRTR